MTSSALVTSLAPCLMVRSEADRLRYVSRHAEDFAAELQGEAGGDQGAAVLRAFDDDDTQWHSGNDAIADRKIFGSGMRVQGEFADDGAAL